MLVNVKLNVTRQNGLPFKVGDIFGHLNFERHSQNEVGNIGILVLWWDREKLYSRDLRFQVFAVFFPDGGMYADVVNGFHAFLRTHLANLRGEKWKKTQRMAEWLDCYEGGLPFE